MAQVTSTGGVTAPTATDATVTPAPAKTSTSPGAGSTPAFKDDLAKATEKLQPVAHHGRAKIIAGAREGQYLNTSGNKRDGQAFTMEYHGGRRWHVYGTGADRVVIAFAKPAAAAAKGADGGAEAGKTATPTGSVTTVPAAGQTGKALSTVKPAAGGAVALG